MKVTLVNRKPFFGQYSLEKIANVLVNASNDSFEIDSVNVPYNGTAPLALIKNILYVRKVEGLVHISGDIYYAGLLKRDVIITYHDTRSILSGGLLKKVLKYILWILLPICFARKVVVISESTYKEIRNLVPFLSDTKVIRIDNPITMNLTRDKDVIERSSNEVLFIGTKANKNLNRCFQALEGLNVHISIVGSLSNDQWKLIEDLKLDVQVYININDDELSRLYRKSTLLSFVSLYEGFGLPLIEAQHHSTAVLTSSIEPFLSVSGNSCHHVDPLSIASIRNGYIRLLDSADYRQSLVDRGLENIKRFSADIFIEKHLVLYESAVCNR